MPTVTATFETRREAELAVEHLVQDHQIDRDAIVIGPEGDENTAGTEIGGADQATDYDDDEGDPALDGSIRVAVSVETDDLAETVQEFFEEFGGGDVASDDG